MEYTRDKINYIDEEANKLEPKIKISNSYIYFWQTKVDRVIWSSGKVGLQSSRGSREQ